MLKRISVRFFLYLYKEFKKQRKMSELQEIRNLIDKIIKKHISKGSDLSIINDFEQIDYEILKVIKS